MSEAENHSQDSGVQLQLDIDNYNIERKSTASDSSHGEEVLSPHPKISKPSPYMKVSKKVEANRGSLSSLPVSNERENPAADKDDDDSDLESILSSSVCTFDTFSHLGTKNEAISHNAEEARKQSFGGAPLSPMKQKNSPKAQSAAGSFFRKNAGVAADCGDGAGMITSNGLYRTTSIFENMDLKVRCGSAQRKNSRKYMEDSIVLCPSYWREAADKSNLKSHHDFSFCAVFDGHGGSYVSQYLKDHLMHYFAEKLHLNMAKANSASPHSDSADPPELVWRTSILEAASQVDREILGFDHLRLLELNDQRQAAFEGLPSNGVDGTEGRDAFAGSTAAFVVVFQPLPNNKVSADSPNANVHTCENDESFFDDVIVDTSNLSDAGNECDSSELGAECQSDNELNENGAENLLPKKTLKRTTRKYVSKHSSIESCFDEQTTALNLDDENALNALDCFHEKMFLPHGRRSSVARRRDSYGSVISDLTISYGNISLTGSSDDLLRHYSRFNPKQANLIAAVKRSYEASSLEDFSAYDSFELGELAEQFLHRASVLEKAATNYRGQATELLQVLQSRVNSNALAESVNSSLSPYCTSTDASVSANSDHRTSGVDDMSDISQSTGIVSSKSNSSKSSINSLKTFDEGYLQMRKAKSNMLDPVVESLVESRSTSFAASRHHSSASFGSKVIQQHDVLKPQNSSKLKLLVSHTGDSRVVLSDNGKAVQLTVDHTPMLESECIRIKNSGGFVSNRRVNGILSVSRSFGDIKFKQFKAETPSPQHVSDEISAPGGIWNCNNQVISLPEVLELEISPSFEFLIVASDCVWQTLSCTESVLFVREQLLEHGDTARAAEALAVKVSSEGGYDNCSIIVICLNQM